MGIDVGNKVLVFSDSLDLNKVLDIQEMTADLGFQREHAYTCSAFLHKVGADGFLHF